MSPRTARDTIRPGDTNAQPLVSITVEHDGHRYKACPDGTVYLIVNTKGTLSRVRGEATRKEIMAKVEAELSERARAMRLKAVRAQMLKAKQEALFGET